MASASPMAPLSAARASAPRGEAASDGASAADESASALPAPRGSAPSAARMPP
jgi:hypothetical protein